MRKIVVHRAGSYDRLVLEEHPDPVPGPGEVAVAVQAAGVNYADCIVRMGLYASAKEYVGWPITPGFEVAGTVAAVGEGVDDLEVGADVMAVTRFGGYASRLVVPREQVFARPAALGVVEAAAFPTVHLTAWYALVELCRLRPGMRILVHSAAGGVGGALSRLGSLAGCQVVGVVGGSHKVDVALERGADAVIDKSSEDLWAAAERHAPDGYHVVLDANGVATLRGSYAHLASRGRLVVYGFHTMMPRTGGRPRWTKLAIDLVRTPRFSPLKLTNENRSVMGFNLSYLFDEPELLAEGMGELLSHVEAGRLTSPPVTAFPLERVADAHRAIESGETVGKLVLTV